MLRCRRGHAPIGAFQQQSVVTCEAMSRGDMQRRFDAAAGTFDAADFALATTRDGLLARLEPISIDARYIIDLGSATGSAGRALERRFKRAHILAVDLSQDLVVENGFSAGRRYRVTFFGSQHRRRFCQPAAALDAGFRAGVRRDITRVAKRRPFPVRDSRAGQPEGPPTPTLR